MKTTNYKVIKQAVFFLLLFITVVWFFPFMVKGIDTTDMAYYLINYKYFFSSDVDLRSVGTIFTDLLGAGIYHLRNSGQAMLLAVCHWALYMGSGLIVYRCLKNYVQKHLLLLGILGGSLFSLTGIHIMNYNATSMFIQTMAICVLIRGIEKERSRFIVTAGIIFGVNTFFRLPNILQICVGISILWYYALGKGEVKTGIIKCAQFAGGVFGGWTAGGTAVLLIAGKEKVLAYFFRTSNMLGSSENSHGIVNILTKLYVGAKEGIKNWVIFGSVLLIILIIWNLLVKKAKFHAVIEKKVFICFGILTVLYGIYAGWKLEYLQFYQMIGMCILVVMAAGAVYYRKRNLLVSSVCVITFCAEAVLSIGTDNGWNYQVVFLIFPLCACLLAVSSCTQESLRKNFMLCMLFTAAMLFVVGVRYATQYVYRDAPNNQLKYTVNAEEYSGFLTSKERAEYIDDLEVALEPLKNEYLLSYGDFNTGYVITDMKPLPNRVWIDLQSYPSEQFKKDIYDGIKEKNYPVIILADLDQDGVYRSEEKLEIIEAVMKEGHYQEYYVNDYYKIFTPEGMKF